MYQNTPSPQNVALYHSITSDDGITSLHHLKLYNYITPSPQIVALYHSITSNCSIISLRRSKRSLFFSFRRLALTWLSTTFYPALTPSNTSKMNGGFYHLIILILSFSHKPHSDHFHLNYTTYQFLREKRNVFIFQHFQLYLASLPKNNVLLCHEMGWGRMKNRNVTIEWNIRRYLSQYSYIPVTFSRRLWKEFKRGKTKMAELCQFFAQCGEVNLFFKLMF